MRVVVVVHSLTVCLRETSMWDCIAAMYGDGGMSSPPSAPAARRKTAKPPLPPLPSAPAPAIGTEGEATTPVAVLDFGPDEEDWQILTDSFGDFDIGDECLPEDWGDDYLANV